MKKIFNCLDISLQELCQKVQKHQGMEEKVKALLPAEFAAHCQVASFQQGCLLLTTTDPVWASQLRFALPELRDQLRKNGIYQLSTIQLKLAAETKPAIPKPEPKAISKISKKGRISIEAGADSCTFEPLKEALIKLARD